MATNLGPGVSRVLEPVGREFREVILQQGKPPMDAEFNLLQELAQDVSRKIVVRGVPSGWLGNETNLRADYQTNPQWSNWFKFGPQRPGEKQSVMWAAVNGWLIPVTGTRTGTPPGSPNETDTANFIMLDPPPANSGDQRADFVFLEAWLARVAPNPSTINKPNSSSIYRYGNVEGGYNYLLDDLVDPNLGFETSQRVQLQYRVRVVKGLLGLSSYPDGFDPTVVKAKGAYDPTHPDTQTSFTFQNMRQELGDPGLWRAGDGTQNVLGSVDGYVYAIPLCVVFRRNSVVWTGHPSPNLNGAINRNPTAVDRTGVKTFSTVPTLATAMSAATPTLTLVSAANIPLPATSTTPIYIRVGGEIMTYQGISGVTLSNLQRGQAGTVAESHPAGATVEILSSRPDGLFADQVAHTDILDLRHVVNPNGFNYDALLRYNLDKLLQGELRSNWKRSGGGTQGVLLNYQDCISNDTAALSVTQLDSPDGFRTIFSDAITAQPFDVVATPVTGITPISCNVGWDLGLDVRLTYPANKTSLDWRDGDKLTVQISQLKSGLGSDTDQVRWLHDPATSMKTVIRLEGDQHPLSEDFYTVTSSGLDPAVFGPNDDLVITLGNGPGNVFPTITGRNLYIKVYALYGSGRGTSRIPDVPHSVVLQSPSTTLMYEPAQYPSNNYRVSTAHVPQWSRHTDLPPVGQPGPMPVTAESYIDPGSKTLIMQPFRRIVWPSTILPQDGTAANVSSGTAKLQRTTGSTNGSTTFTDSSANYTTAGVVAGDALILKSGFQKGRYTVVTVTSATQLVLDRSLLDTQTGLEYEVRAAQGLMPTKKRDGTTAKWITTDPLGLFSGSTDNAHPTTKNMYVSFPAHLVPKAGAVHVPIQPNNTSLPFYEGINYMFVSGEGNAYAPGDSNYVPYLNGSFSYSVFSTVNLAVSPYTTPATYNGSFTLPGIPIAGMRKFTDPRGMGRQGLELPPFYGVTRIFGVYEAQDYRTNGSPYNPLNRERTTALGRATNLLKQRSEGATFWIEADDDGDSTFILNAECLDLSRSPNPIANFAAGDYVVEASIFGFDRDAFVEVPPTVPFTTAPLNGREVRIVLTRYIAGSVAMRQQAINTDPTTGRAANLTTPLAGPTSILPGPLTAADTVLYNFSRTPYGGDAWGTQTNNVDIGYQAGPLLSETAYQVASTKPDLNNLSRPNEKVFEILASLPFTTTAGTGRMSGNRLSLDRTMENPGFEVQPGNYPPPNALADRPAFHPVTYVEGMDPYFSRYNGLTERLPLGALWRDKDFRGVTYNDFLQGSFRKEGGEFTVGAFAGMSPRSNLEAHTLWPMADSSLNVGSMVVHVDGSVASSGSPFLNFRTNRGGSGYVAGGDNPGGWFAPGVLGTIAPRKSVVDPAEPPYTNVMAGVAYLVRNTVTNKGMVEVSAGDELMMLIATQVHMPMQTGPQPIGIALSTVGVGEGHAALDYYRIDGHPLVRDHVMADINPSTIQLAGP